MARQAVDLGGLHFNKLSDAKEYIKSLLNSFTLSKGELVDVPSDMYPVLMDCLGRHPRIQDKIPSFPRDVEKLIVRRTDFGNNEFCYVLANGLVKDFSYIKCLTKTNTVNHKQYVIGILRDAISDQVRLFKKKNIVNGEGVCYLSKIKFSSKDLVVDHFYPFSFLVDDFLEFNGIKIEDIEIDYDDKRKDRYKTFKDKSLLKFFEAYHKNNAELCLIHKKLNIMLNNKCKEGEVFEQILKRFVREITAGA